jgi:hypothetical protein
MIPLPLLDGDTLLIDSSSTSDVMTCKRLAEYSFCRHLKPDGEKAALKAGGIAHKVLETRYRMGTPMYQQDDTVEKAMIACAEDEYSRWTPPEDDFRTFSTMVSMIRAYGAHHPIESFTILTLPDGKPFIEVPFLRPLCTVKTGAEFLVQPLKLTPTGLTSAGTPFRKFLPEVKVAWIGRIDMVYETSSGIYVMDHKTSTMASNTSEFTLSHQMYGYVGAVEHLLGTQVAGFVVNRIVWRKPTRTGTPFTFERALNPVSRPLLAEWHRDITHIIADLLEAVRRGYMQKETTWCYGKFGQCPFFKVCTLDTPEQREIMLQSGEYIANEWSPLT